MFTKEKLSDIYTLCLLPISVFALIWAIAGFPLHRVDGTFLLFAAVTIGFASGFRIRLPQYNTHVTASEALVIFGLFYYGVETAILLSVCETAISSLHLRRSGVWIRPRTLLFNVQAAAIVMFATGLGFELLAGQSVAAQGTFGFLTVVAGLSLSLFLLNLLLVSPFLSLVHDRPLAKVVQTHTVDTFVVYLTGTAAGGFLFKTVEHLAITFVLAAIPLLALVLWSHRRALDEARRASFEVRETESRRAEQAETHLHELEEYVADLERRSDELRLSREKFRHAAYHDALTGLPNRLSFIEKIDELLTKQAIDNSFQFGLLYLDLDRFKTLNESLGHSMGDMLITHVAARLKNVIGKRGVVGRFGGDEFAIILENLDCEDDAHEIGREIARQLAEPFSLDGRQVFSGVSIGIAFGNNSYGVAEELLRDADIAMYQAKGSDRAIEIFDPKMHLRAVSLLELETDLRTAIKKKQFELFYQPIVDLDNLSISGFEALVRWPHPTRGLISPADFIPLAETTGMIVPMTLQILRDACTTIRSWNDLTTEAFTVSVNLSGKHLSHPGLVDQVISILDETGIRPASLKLEITESAVMENAENAIATLRRIRETGVRICIDDFGTGYSSLSYLHRFPIDTLKVDRSFVMTMENGSENGEIVRVVLALAMALKLDVVAEGIESVHQLHQLRILGCQYGQGYLFSRAMPADAITEMITGYIPWKNALSASDLGVIARNAIYTQLKWTQ